MRWLWRRTTDTSDEAAAELAKLTARDPEVAALGRELREVQRRNNFSALVDAAIRRGAHGGA